MALDSKISGSSSGNPVEADANGNLNVVTPVIASKAGYVMLAGRQSEATDPAGLVQEALRISTQGRLTVGQPVVLLNEMFNNTTLNSAIFTAPVTTQTVTAAGGTLNLNASGITTVSTVSRVSTYVTFPLWQDFATYATWQMALTQVPQANAVIEAGFGICTASTTPTDGAFFRYDATGTLKAVVNTNGSEITSSAGLTAPSATVMHKYKIIIENDRVFFYIDGACVDIIETTAAVAYPLYTPSQPFFVRTYNTAVAPTLANIVKVGSIWVALQDAAGLGKDNGTIGSLMGRTALQGQTGHPVGTTALLSNSLAPGAGAAMSNTAASLGSGLGGQFAALPTLAVNTDGIVCSYQNPAATSALPGKTLYIKGVRIQGCVTTALTGGPVTYEYSLAFGATSASLATTESATAKAPRRTPIGFENFVVTAPIGTIGSPDGQRVQFQSPIAINPGEFIQVVAKNINTVTTLGVITFVVTFDGYFE
jgi:hypothetical protein